MAQHVQEFPQPFGWLKKKGTNSLKFFSTFSSFLLNYFSVSSADSSDAAIRYLQMPIFSDQRGGCRRQPVLICNMACIICNFELSFVHSLES